MRVSRKDRERRGFFFTSAVCNGTFTIISFVRERDILGTKDEEEYNELWAMCRTRPKADEVGVYRG